VSPEVILRSGATKASDIWSIGCTVIEMITGKPPYFDLGPMSAMFQITSDDHPPIPDHISQDLVHFLYCCFSKNPEDRYSAKQLQQHPWMPSPTRQLVSFFFF
jgi:serine/threonine protein kinase